MYFGPRKKLLEEPNVFQQFFQLFMQLKCMPILNTGQY